MMARDRNSWACCVTLAQHEYVAKVDCERFGLHPFLPQIRKAWTPRGDKPMLRATPMFPRYFFIPLAEARARPLHHVRGLLGHRFLLTSMEGTIFTAPGGRRAHH